MKLKDSQLNIDKILFNCEFLLMPPTLCGHQSKNYSEAISHQNNRTITGYVTRQHADLIGVSY